MEVSETYKVNDTQRIAVWIDEQPSNPLIEWDCWDNLGMAIIHAPSNTDRARFTLKTDSETDDLVRAAIEASKNGDGDVEDILNDNGFPAIQTTIRGYSQGDWLEVVAYSENPYTAFESPIMVHNNLATMLDNVGTYFRGDVYVVALQNLVTWTGSNGETRESWENSEWVVADCFFTEGTPNETEARDYLGLEVRAA